MANFAIDLAPLRKSRDFSLLWAAGLISYFGSMITYVAVPFQIKELTGSYVAVAISGLVEIVPFRDCSPPPVVYDNQRCRRLCRDLLIMKI